MVGELIPPEALREYSRARNLGALIDLLLPLAAAAAVVLLGGELTGSAAAGGKAGNILWLKHALVVFSVSVCIAARIILGRLMAEVRRVAHLGAYRCGRVFFSYLALYSLYLVPAVWGFAFFILSGDSVGYLVLAGITALAFLFLTPHISHFWRKPGG